MHPLLKKPSLCKDVLSNYRLVSNLFQLLKVAERVVSNRLNIHHSQRINDGRISLDRDSPTVGGPRQCRQKRTHTVTMAVKTDDGCSRRTALVGVFYRTDVFFSSLCGRCWHPDLLTLNNITLRLLLTRAHHQRPIRGWTSGNGDRTVKSGSP